MNKRIRMIKSRPLIFDQIIFWSIDRRVTACYLQFSPLYACETTAVIKCRKRQEHRLSSAKFQSFGFAAQFSCNLEQLNLDFAMHYHPFNGVTFLKRRIQHFVFEEICREPLWKGERVNLQRLKTFGSNISLVTPTWIASLNFVKPILDMRWLSYDGRIAFWSRSCSPYV